MLSSESARHYRPRSVQPVYVTEPAFDRLLGQLVVLTTSKKPQLLARIRQAGKVGVAGRSQLDALEDELAIIEGLIRHLRTLTRDAVLINYFPSPDGSASVGARVVLETNAGDQAVRIVGRLEADPTVGLISNESPLGEVLLGCRAGDRIRWRATGRLETAIVRSVDWGCRNHGDGPEEAGATDSSTVSGPTLDWPTGLTDHVEMGGWVWGSPSLTTGASSTTIKEAQP